MPDEPMRRPWSATASAHEATHGHWADYAAWQRWLAAEVTREFPQADLIFTSLDADQAAGLYLAMCNLADGNPEVSTHAG